MTKRAIDNITTEPAPMEQVRELLFGAQLKDMETRFKRQEERFVREVADAKESLRKRIDSLENFMKSEVTGILARIKEEQKEREESIKLEQRERADIIKSEQRERAEAVAQLASDIASANETFERKLAKLSDTLDATERDLRSLFLDESKSLGDKIEAKYQDSLSVISKTAAQIRHDMVYRSALSSMFTEMVVKLSGAQWSDEGSMLDTSLDSGYLDSPNQDYSDND